MSKSWTADLWVDSKAGNMYNLHSWARASCIKVKLWSPWYSDNKKSSQYDNKSNERNFLVADSPGFHRKQNCCGKLLSIGACPESCRKQEVQSPARRRVGTGGPGKFGDGHMPLHPHLHISLFIPHPKASFHIFFSMGFLSMWTQAVPGALELDGPSPN